MKNKLIVGVLALVLGVATAFAVGATPPGPPLVDVPLGEGPVALQCDGDTINQEVLDWPPVDGELPADTPGPIGLAQAADRVPDFVTVGGIGVGRENGKAKLALEMDDFGRLTNVFWCDEFPGPDQLWPELGGGGNASEGIIEVPGSARTKEDPETDNGDWLKDAEEAENGQ